MLTQSSSVHIHDHYTLRIQGMAGSVDNGINTETTENTTNKLRHRLFEQRSNSLYASDFSRQENHREGGNQSSTTLQQVRGCPPPLKAD